MADHVLSKRNKNKLVHENHIYVFSKKTKNGEHGIWVRELRSSCKGRVWTNGKDGEVVKTVTHHNHAAQAARPAAIRLVTTVKERAATTQESPHQIIANVIPQAHADVAAIMPKKDALKKTIRRARRDEEAPALPRNMQELVIPRGFSEIVIDGEVQQFLMYDSENQLMPGRILIFSTRSNLHLLAQSQEWFADGTFSTAPAIFEQLYTLHAIKNSAVVPLVYALLPNKTRATYVTFLQQLKRLQPGLQPTQLMTDFELAAMQAFELEFPGILKTGCFFHLSQSVWRKVQSEGPKARYENDHEFARWIRMIPALAFVPEHNVSDSFTELLETEGFPEEAVPIANYFEDTYIGRRLRRGRQIPLFPTQIWNVYQRTLNDQHRTNNHVEGWHRAFQETCGSQFPNIFRFIECLRKQQGIHNYEIIQSIAGNQGNPRNKKYVAISARIKRIVEDFEDRHLTDYLHGIAYNFEF
ncbi:hypothetical protein PPYR_00018 [Photinus pyralis]|uniref:MULE transposase domain-containing protein n=1 Tax=Photinus pyralis TaxID=7054 RepID=A0A5N4B0K9_PHOPY|nr:hypothetical protein PPYR_00018 [Photinus pyralis]